ncbi:MAG: hypothetical protein ACP5QU_04135 [Anaerolineae bacterium]
MNILSTSQEKDEVFPSTEVDPFPERQTIPKGWDLSGLIPVSRWPAVESTEEAAPAGYR